MQITPYESIDWDYADSHSSTALINSYMIRKALIRKHFLSLTVDTWVAKHPDSVLRTHVKRSEHFEVDYAEFLDDALVEAFDLRASLERNEALDEEDAGDGNDQIGDGSGEKGGQGRMGDSTAHEATRTREWWILKPSMSDRGQGIRLFSTMEELQAIFDGWEEDEPESDDGQDYDDPGEGTMAQQQHRRHQVQLARRKRETAARS